MPTPAPISAHSPAPDSPIYVYGFGLRPPMVWPPGIAGPVQWIGVDLGGGNLGAIAEVNLDLAPLQAQEEALLRAVVTHDQVLQATFAQGPVLPLRFGTQFLHRAALETYLAKAGDHHRAQLLALGDRAEYPLMATPLPPEPDPPLEAATGRGYFLAKKARLQAQAARQQAQQDQWLDVVATLKQQFPLAMAEGEAFPPRLYVLAPRSGQELDQVLETLPDQAPLWIVRRSDPLPPYHFPTIPDDPIGPSPRSPD